LEKELQTNGEVVKVKMYTDGFYDSSHAQVWKADQYPKSTAFKQLLKVLL
jgi:hypothetical protein